MESGIRSNVNNKIPRNREASTTIRDFLIAMVTLDHVFL